MRHYVLSEAIVDRYGNPRIIYRDEKGRFAKAADYKTGRGKVYSG